MLSNDEGGSRQKNLLIVCLCFVVFVVSVIFGNVRYETNDDTVFNLIAAGAYGEPSQYLLYLNIIYGYFLKMMYFLVPVVNWYLWMFLIADFCGVVALCLIFSSKLKTIPALALTAGINFILYDDFYLNVQFTKIAAFNGIVGLSLLLWAVYHKNHERMFRLAAVFFLGFGLCIRPLAVAMIFPFFLMPFTHEFIKSKRHASFLVHNFAMITTVAVVLLSANYATYYLSPEWKNYMEWNSIMVERSDHGNYNFEWNREEYLENGFTETDFKLLDFWFWGDTEYFTLDKLKLMKEIGSSTRVDTLKFSPEVLNDTVKRVTASINIKPYLLIFTALLMLGVITLNPNIILFFLLQFLVAFGEYYYLICTRRIEWRVECGILLTMIISTTLWSFRHENAREKAVNTIKGIGGKGIVSAILLVVTAACVLMIGCRLADQFVNIKNGYALGQTDGNYEQIKEISESEELYVLSVDSAFGGMCGAKNIYSITKDNYYDYFHNITPIGGFIIPSPIALYHANVAGIANPFRALFERDDVYYVGGAERMGYVLVFLQEKYGTDITVEYVDTIGDQDVWKYKRAQ